MSVTCIIGAQWGDEGKGKIVDILSKDTDAVVRYNGGPNAGHTIYYNDKKIVLKLIPSGILNQSAKCFLGHGMVIDLNVLVDEINNLKSLGVPLENRLFISQFAHVILPYHIQIDSIRENSSSKIGTTKRGIGPCYEDKIGRRGIRMCDLLDENKFKQLLNNALEYWTPIAIRSGVCLDTINKTINDLKDKILQIKDLICDTNSKINNLIENDKKIIVEGAQGTMLDIDYGTYPYVSSSSATAGGICSGCGIGPLHISKIIGLSKAYTTRVGEGPFHTELFDDYAKHLQGAGHEFGSVTGRPRRVGWLDLIQLRYAKQVNSLSSLILTKLDVLTGLDIINVCVGYRYNSKNILDLSLTDIEKYKPIYISLTGWKENISHIRSFNNLPTQAKNYVEFISRYLELPIDMISVGPKRDEVIFNE